MKKILRSTGLTAILLTLMLAVSSDAQTTYTADIPFDFSVGKKLYKAGPYSLGLMFSFIDSRKVVMRNARGGSPYVFIPNVSTRGAERATLTFSRTAGFYSLSAIATPQFSVEVTKLYPEERLAGNTDYKIETIVLAAKK